MRCSSLPLLMKCTGAAVLPCDEEESENAARGAEWGTMVHHWAQTGEVRGPSKRLENALQKAIITSGIVREEWWPPGGNHEGKLAIRVDGNGREGREVSRDDTPRSGWVTGHYDYQYWMFDGELWVDDLKTGKFYPNPESYLAWHDPTLPVGANRYPQDVRSVQLRTYALALSELLEYRGDVIVSLTHWPRLPLSARHSRPTRLWTSYSHSELMMHWRDLEVTHAQAEHNRRAVVGQEDSLILVPGDHCRFCPVRDCFVRKEF